MTIARVSPGRRVVPPVPIHPRIHPRTRPTAPDPQDPGPPVLRHGAPRRTSDSDAPAQVASTSPSPSSPSSPPSPRPSIHADEVNGVTRTPDAPKVDAGAAGHPSSRRTGDAVIDMATDAALSFSETLPNYVVKQFTTRYETGAARGGQTSWSALDTVTADVISENGKESYKNLLIDGKAPKEAIEKSGTWSTGEFSSVLLDILQPQTDAEFHNKRATTIVNRSAFRYDFSVEQGNSHWNIQSEGQSYKPEYTGAIWIDKENYRVLRIEMSARNMPKGFPLDTVESADRLRLRHDLGKQISASRACRGAQLRPRDQRLQPKCDRIPQLQKIRGRHEHHLRHPAVTTSPPAILPPLRTSMQSPTDAVPGLRTARKPANSCVRKGAVWWEFRGRISLVVLAAALAVACARNPAAKVLKSAVDAVGGKDKIMALGTLTMEGEGTNPNLGQNLTPEAPLTVWKVTGFTESFDPEKGQMRVEQVRTAQFPFAGATTVRDNHSLDGNIAWDTDQDGNAARSTQRAALERRVELLHHPIAILRAAFDPSAKVGNYRQHGVDELIDITTVHGDTVTLAVATATHLPVSVTSRADQPNLGDVAIETKFLDYEDQGGLKLPTHLVSTIDKWVRSDIRVSKNSINAPVNLAAPAAVRDALAAPARSACQRNGSAD